MAEKVTLSLEGMKDRFRFLGDNFIKTVFNAMLVSSEAMLANTVKAHMSGPKRGSSEGLLGVDTGTARRSMTNRTTLSGGVIEAADGSPLGYVKAQEEGFHGVVQVRAHTRRIVSLSRNTKTGRISKISARRYKQAVKQGRKRVAFVRSHGRKVDISAKHFIAYGVMDAVPGTERRIEKSLMFAAATGRVPTRSDIAGGFRA